MRFHWKLYDYIDDNLFIVIYKAGKHYTAETNPVNSCASLTNEANFKSFYKFKKKVD